MEVALLYVIVVIQMMGLVFLFRENKKRSKNSVLQGKAIQELQKNFKNS